MNDARRTHWLRSIYALTGVAPVGLFLVLLVVKYTLDFRSALVGMRAVLAAMLVAFIAPIVGMIAVRSWPGQLRNVYAVRWLAGYLLGMVLCWIELKFQWP